MEKIDSNKILAEHLGKVMKVLRSEAGMSQIELAESSGIPQSTITRIESGAVQAKLVTIHTLLAQLGFTWLGFAEYWEDMAEADRLRYLFRN